MKRSNIWVSGIVVEHICITIDLVSFKVILCHSVFVHCDVSENTISKTLLVLQISAKLYQEEKRRGREEKGRKIDSVSLFRFAVSVPFRCLV